MPNSIQLFGMVSAPKAMTFHQKLSSGSRNEAGDTDFLVHNIQDFFPMLAKGQPRAIEMLFAPETCIQKTSPVWDTIVANRDLFLSKVGILPFLGFARAQARKSVQKGGNLNLIRDIIAWGETVHSHSQPLDLSAEFFGKMMILGNVKLPITTNASGYQVVEVAGRFFDLGISVRNFLRDLRRLESRYGNRAEDAAANGADRKSLMHAVRLVSQAQEYLAFGKMTFPRPPEEVKVLLDIRNGTDGADWLPFLEATLQEIEKVDLPASSLPESPDLGAINNLCASLVRTSILGET